MADSPNGGTDTSFKVTLLRVMAVQVVALVLLWILQARYHG